MRKQKQEKPFSAQGLHGKYSYPTTICEVRHHFSAEDDDDDSGDDNFSRAAWARTGVIAYAREKNCVTEPLDQCIADLICDLAHLCDHEGVKLVECIRIGGNAYQSETDSKGDQLDGVHGWSDVVRVWPGRTYRVITAADGNVRLVMSVTEEGEIKTEVKS